eukprot:scaffold333_cov230-Pinguiococcus_pyrenoidosus.AAC.4
MLRRSMVWRLFTRFPAMRTVRGVCFGCHKGVVHRPACALQQLGRGFSLSSAEPVDLFPKLRKQLKDGMRQEDDTVDQILEALSKTLYNSDKAILAMAQPYFKTTDKAAFRDNLALFSKLKLEANDIVATACLNILDHEARTTGTSQMPCLELCRET